MILDKIKADQLSARKSRKALEASLLTTLIGDIEMVGKNAQHVVLDSESIAVVKKFIKNIDSSLEVVTDTVQRGTLFTERQILENYLPLQFTESELREVINKLKIVHLGNVGAVMKDLKAAHSGCYDGKLASDICKETS